MKKIFPAWIMSILCTVVLYTATATRAETENSSFATDHQRMILVLDASGSMWGKIEGKTKIEIAKAVLTDLIKDLPDQSIAGLVAYGHRREGDCQDVEELAPLQLLDKNLLIDKIRAITPRGKTPITLSIRKIAEQLKGAEEETTIILVSDGKETCDSDPCALVKELKAAGIRFTMYVIGFDVTEAENAQLECMAKEGDGQYFTAKTAGEFRVAARQAVQESRNFGHLKITALRNRKPIAARLDIFLSGQEKTVRSSHTLTDMTRPGEKLKPGVYDLNIIDEKMKPSQSVRISGVTIAAGSTAEKTAEFNGGELKIAVSANGQKETAGLYVYPAGKDSPLETGDTSRDNPKTFILAPGKYDLKVVYRKSRPETVRRFDGITIKNNETIEKQVAFGEGRLNIEVLVNGSKGNASLYVYEAGTGKRVTTGDTSRDNPKTFTLLPGVYDLQVVYRKSRPETEHRFDGIEIKAGQTVEKQTQFSEGQLSIEALVNGGKGSAGFYVFEAGTDKRITTGDTSRDNPNVITLNAGHYDIKVVYRKAIPEKEILLKNIEVIQAQTIEKRVDYQEGTLEIQVTSGGNATRGSLTFFHPGESKRFATGNAGKPIKLQPGEYEVAVKAYKLPDKPEKRVSFTIQTGQTTNLTIDF